MTTTAQADVVVLLVLLGVVALGVLAATVARSLTPLRPTLPEDDCPPPGLGRLVPVGRQVDAECRRGFEALERWLASRQVRP